MSDANAGVMREALRRLALLLDEAIQRGDSGTAAVVVQIQGKRLGKIKEVRESFV